MLKKTLLSKLTLIRLFTFVFISAMLFACSNSTNETVTSENVLNDSPAFFEPKMDGEFEGDTIERENWFIQQRKYPFDELPENTRRNAWLSRPADADGPETANWQPIGPSPTNAYFLNNWGMTSGRINAIAVAPNNAQLVLIGAATGGIWRSTNGGTSFTSVSDNHVDLAVGSIAFSPSNPSIVYAGMGDKAHEFNYFGTGVLKSTDGGQTWAQINNNTLPAQGKINKIQVDPANSNRVYIAQHSVRQGNTTNILSGIWVSSDGGVSWQRTLAGFGTDLVIHPTQANTIYAGLSVFSNGGQNFWGGVFKSTDSGQNWSQVRAAPNGANTVKLSVSPAAPQWIYALVGFFSNNTREASLELSTDGGSTWNTRGNQFDKGQIPYNCYILASPVNPNVLLIGTRDVWASNNAGDTYFNITKNFNLQGQWMPVQLGATSHPDQHHAFIAPSNPSVIYIANDGGLSRSTDSGVTFQSLNASLSLTMFTSIDLHPTNAAISYGGTQDNGTQKRTGNSSWREFSAGDGGQTVIDPLDPSIVYTTYINHDTYRWTNNGDSFGATIGSDTVFANDRVAFYPPFVGNDVNSTLYFGTYRLWISTNRGNSWTAPGGTTDLTNGGKLSAIGVGKSNTNTIYTGSSDGKLWVSANGGASWVNRSAGLPNRFIKSIIVNRNDANTAYVTVSGFDSGHVFKTVNAGASWTDISGNLPNIPTNTLLIDANTPTTLYVGTDVGVFRSTTDGNTWETYNTGMPPVIISELDMQAGGLMQAATYGRGAYQMIVAQGCSYAINPASQNVGAAAGSGSFTMTTAAGCGWQASSNAAWLTTSSSGSGNGTITFNYAANTSAQARTGQITVGGQTFTLTQAGQSPTCNYSISPTSQNFNQGGGAGSFTVTAPGGCAWTATASSSLLERLTEGYESKLPVFNFDIFADSPTAVFPANAGSLGAIPDGPGNPQTPGAARDVTFAVSGITGNVSNVEISLTATHTWVGDVQATLIAPNGATHRLFGYTGATTATSFGDGSDLGGTYVFKDTASPPSGGWWQEAVARTDTQGLTAGDYRTTNSGGAGATNPMPATGMNQTFAGVSNANGVWTLRITDGAAQDVGSITAASLTVAGGSQPGGWLTITSAASGSGTGTINYSVAAFSGQSRTGTITLSANGQTQATHTVNQSANQPPSTRRAFDFDGDGRTDLGVFRPSGGGWYIYNLANGTNQSFFFGLASDKITPADYDGDGKTDVAVYRSGTWYILQSSNNQVRGVTFGTAEDLPRPGDYDGDGKADINVFRPSNGTWYRLNSSNNQFVGAQFGLAGDAPLIADFDGDAKSDLAVFRAGVWYYLQSSDGGFRGVSFGLSSDIPTPGDYDGDGKSDVSVFRPSDGTWYRINSSNGGFTAAQFGQTGDRPTPGDYDGDGKTDLAVFRNGNWFVLRSSNNSFTGLQFGAPTDAPVPAAYLP